MGTQDWGSRVWASPTPNLRTRPSLVLEWGSSHDPVWLQIRFSPISSFPVPSPSLHKPNVHFLSHFSLPFGYSVSFNKHLHLLQHHRPEHHRKIMSMGWHSGGHFPASASPSQKNRGFVTQRQRVQGWKGHRHLSQRPKNAETLLPPHMSTGREAGKLIF